MKKRVGDESICRFKDAVVQGRFNEISAVFEIEFIYATGRARDLEVTIDTALVARDKKSLFILYGQPTDLVYKEGEFNVRGIIDLPVMWVGLDPAAESPRLVGDLRMSSMKICPKRGMDNVVNITILDESGSETIDEIGVKIDEASLEQDYTIVCDLPRLKTGQAYQVRANIDL